MKRICLLIAALALAAPACAAKPDEADKDAKHRAAQTEFLRGPIVSIAFEVKAEDIEALEKNPRHYVEGKMTVGDKTWKGVALKLKGADGSFKPVHEKPCFTLNLDKFKGAERFHGFKKLHLNNANEDPSFLRQQLCGEMVRAAGTPAIRCTHAFVSLNGRDLGLYVFAEGYTPDLLAPFFADPHGDLYEGGFCKDIDAELTKDAGDKKDFRAIEQLLAACRTDDAAERWAKLRAVLDVERFATFLALETLLGIDDGYDFFRNNYRLYHDPKTKLLSFIPHGMDQPLREVEFGIQRGPESIVGRAFTGCAEGRALYRARVAELYEKVLKSRDWPAQVSASSAKVLAALAKKDAGLAKDLRGKQEELRDTVARRIAFVGKALGEMPEPLRFDKGIARLAKGWTTKQEGDAKLERVEEKGLRVVADGECQASWRCAVELAAGRYRFEGAVKTKGVTGAGAGLRISGKDPAGEWLTGTASKAVSYEFDAEGGEVVLVAELRATKGEAVFALESLRLVRVR